jgi:hypothetical protein
MKLIATLAFAVGAMVSLVVDAATVQYKISNSPSDAFTQHGGLSGHRIFAGIEGTFAISYQAGESPILSDLDLRLVNVTENFDLPHFNIADFEGTPIEVFMSHDLEGSAAFHYMPGSFAQFALPQLQWPPLTIITAPYSSMRVDFVGELAMVYLGSMLTPLGTLDGGSVAFDPLTATLVPEPAALVLAGTAMLGFALCRGKSNLLH